MLHLPMREKDYTPPVLNLVFHLKLWMKHGLRGQIPMEMIIKIFNYNNNNSNNSNSNSNKRWMPEGLGVVLDPVF